MKNYFKMILNGQTAFRIAMFTVLSLILVSCTQEESGMIDEPVAELAIFDLLSPQTTKAGNDLTKRQGAPSPGDQSIAEIAIAGGFGELVQALLYVDEEFDAGLVDLFLNGTDQYTVFAPNDAAFFALYEVLMVDEIREVDAAVVLNVLLYHVVEGRRAANSVVPPRNDRTINTLLGQSFSVDRGANITAKGNTAGFIATDISASNGIIHVIDTVLLPNL